MSKKIFLILTVLLLLRSSSFSQSNDKLNVENVIVSSYIHGLINAEDFKLAKEGIHEDFIIWGHTDSLLTKKTRDEWISQRMKRSNLEKVKYTVVYIDIEGDAASAKIRMARGDIIANDYIFLYKFNNRWRIVTAIDHVEKVATLNSQNR